MYYLSSVIRGERKFFVLLIYVEMLTMEMLTIPLYKLFISSFMIVS